MAGESLQPRVRTIKRFQEESVWASGRFTVDADGAVWRGSKRAEHRMPNGYLQVRVMVDGVMLYTGAHRLVWRAMNGPIPDGLTINHKNGVKDDNRPENLEIVTPSENTKHAYRIGLMDEHGERNPAAKLSDEAVKAIRLLYATGEFTMEAIGRLFGVRFQQVSRIVRGQRRPKQPGPVIGKDLRHNACDRDPASGQFVKRAG